MSCGLKAANLAEHDPLAAPATSAAPVDVGPRAFNPQRRAYGTVSANGERLRPLMHITLYIGASRGVGVTDVPTAMRLAQPYIDAEAPVRIELSELASGRVLHVWRYDSNEKRWTDHSGPSWAP